MKSDCECHVLYNARIHTMDRHSPEVSALVIEDGIIIDTGDQEAITARYKGTAKFFNLDGLTIIPGLIDAHIHLQHYALSLQRVECETPTLEACLHNVASGLADKTPGEWILGHGWNQNEWQEGFGDARMLDSAAPENPVYLTAKSLHAAWVNSAALQAAGINADSADPPGGQIQRHLDGTPTGILFETAMEMVSSLIPKAAIRQVSQAIDTAQKNLWSMGITGAHDFDRRSCFAALQELNANGRLKLRITKSIPIENLHEAVELGLRTGFGNDFLRIGSVKAFADGALGPRTAAMLQPYEDEPENRGILMLDAEELVERGTLAVDNGLSLSVHAIGDSANHEVLRAYSQLRTHEKEKITGEQPLLRHRIEHVQLIHPQDLPRLAEFDLIASMQPIHATSDYPTADRYWGDRSKTAYAWHSLLEAGTRMAFGSDAPVESPNPFWGLHAALTRQRADGSPGPEGWYPDQRISLFNAMQGFTSGAAYAAGMENRLGKLAAGFYADLLLLDQDPYQITPEQIRQLLPLATMVSGEWVYKDPQIEDLISNA